MRSAVRAAALTLVIAAAGCSGNDDSGTIQDFCRRGVPAICARVFACDPQSAAQVYGSEAQCVSQSTPQCSSAQCPSGKSFDASAGDQCVAAYPTASCSDLAQGTYPTVCTTVCR